MTGTLLYTFDFIHFYIGSFPSNTMPTAFCWSKELGIFCTTTINGRYHMYNSIPVKDFSDHEVLKNQYLNNLYTKNINTNYMYSNSLDIPIINGYYGKLGVISKQLATRAVTSWTTLTNDNGAGITWNCSVYSPELDILVNLSQSFSSTCRYIYTNNGAAGWSTYGNLPVSNTSINDACWSSEYHLYVALGGYFEVVLL